MKGKLSRKVNSVRNVERAILIGVAIFLIVSFGVCLPMMAIDLRLWGIFALSGLLFAALLCCFYLGVYINYQCFVEVTSDWANDRHFTERKVVELSYKRFSTFYNLRPERWSLSEITCIYAPKSNKEFAIMFSFPDYLRYKHYELRQQEKENRNREKVETKELDIKTMEQFAEYIKKDLASFEQENPLNILVEKYRKEDGHV